MSTKAPSAWQLQDAMRILMQARASLLQEPLDGEVADILASDPETCEPMDVLHRIIRGAAYDREMKEAAARRRQELAEREARWSRRYEIKRQAIHAAMEALALSKIDLPDITASIKAGPSSVRVSDETALPDQYVRTKREPDKVKLRAALELGEIIPGASLNNSPPVLMIKGT